MKLQYKARTKEGELQVGFIEAPSREAAVNTLSSHDLFILSLQSSEKKAWYEGLFGFLERVSGKDLMIFTRQFATLLSAKIPLSESLRTLEKQTKHPILKNTAFEIISDVDAGLSLSQSLGKYSNIFSPFYVNLIRSAEITGRMEEAANYLADYLEKEVAITGKVKNALIYPAVVVLLFLVVVGVMAAVVLPQIEPIFLEAGVNIPTYTKVILVFGKFIAAWWWATILVLLGAFILIADYFRTPEGRGVMDEIILRTPIFGSILKQLYVARFAESVSILIKGGIPISQTLEISSVTVGSTIYRDLLHQVAEDVRRGELLSQSLGKNEEFFPPLVAQMVAIGESTGRLEELLGRISSFYTREVDSLLGNLVELIQPALMLVIGVLVGGLFASILVPIYNLAQSF
ncbi:MAG TPA: type II secretion system F family protein [Candidatus Paceibacterota bacterium]|nr:type II secretion system F family protein [Candidatus Paceibacterota bacterium]